MHDASYSSHNAQDPFSLQSSKNVIIPPLNDYNANIKKIRGFVPTTSSASPVSFGKSAQLEAVRSVAFGFADRSAYGAHYETKPWELAPVGKDVAHCHGQATLIEPQKQVDHLTMIKRFYQNARASVAPLYREGQASLASRRKIVTI